MDPFNPKNLAILWFTLGNLNPYFRWWWNNVERIHAVLYKVPGARRVRGLQED
jgi:hypothetical protein